MNVTLVTTIYPPAIGGPAVYAWDVSRRLRERGHRVDVVTPTPQDGGDPYVHGTSAFVPPVKFLRGFVRSLLVLLAVMKAGRNADVLFVQSPGHVGYIVTMAGWLLRKPVVVRFPGDVAWEHAFAAGRTTKTLHEFLRAPEGGRGTRLVLRLQKLVLTRARQVIAPSEYIRHALIEAYGVDPARIHAIYHSVDVPERRNGQPAGTGPTLVYVGRLVPHKCIPDLLDAVARLAAHFPDIRLQLVGDGPDAAALKDYAAERGLGDRVTFMGNVKRDAAVAAMRQADVLILPSLWESLSHVAIEAIATGVPVVATRIPGLDEVLTDEVAVLVPPRAPDALAGAIARVLTDRDLARRLVAAGRARALGTFSWQQNLPRLEDVLERARRA